MAKKVRIGVVGCGKISGAYFEMARSFAVLDVVACADLNMDAARAAAEMNGVSRPCTVEELMKDPAIDLVLNLTVPKAHVPVSLAAVEAGKHVYSEKPLGITREEGRRLMEAAKANKVRVGCAPDTFMGAGIQTARKVIDDGRIGRPVAFTAFMMGRGHESWHPSPEFFYEAGGGPMFDMGPYYLTALMNLLGPVRRISGAATIAIPERTITSEPKRGKKIVVQTPDHIAGTIEFENGCVGTIVTSFATMHPQYDKPQPITIYGTEGTMRVPDPNTFDGPVHVRGPKQEEWEEVTPAFVKGCGRAVGVADMAYAIRSGRKHRASGEQAYAVLDLMAGFLDSAESGRAYTPAVKYERPAGMRGDLPFGELDD